MVRPPVLDYAPPAVPPGVYARQWRTYRRRNAAVAVVFVGGVFAPAILHALLEAMAVGKLAAPFAFAVWFGSLLVVGRRAGIWPCPRCGGPFHARPGCRNSFARKCLHCELPLWAGDAGRDDGEEAA